jgi:phage host-nuclease inhibitor protein Gam
MEENFKIDNDRKADWAVERIKECEDEKNRLIALANEKIEELKIQIENAENKFTNETAFLRSLLAEYFETVKTKETKTQKTYALLSGKLVFKKPAQKIVHDDEKLTEWLADTEFIKIKKSVDWAAYKKKLTISGNDVIDTETGEIVEACSVEETPGSFEIKFAE